MGGKQKQSQRTKGNVKPSSSARAAELLVSTGGATGFLGFGALSGDLGYVPTSLGSEDGESSLDADFRMVLRKFAKRDSTTKLKTLQEFSTLCDEKDAETVKAVLPFWPRIYSKMAIDHDRRVREATQVALERLVLKVRRSLAPFLKGLMGPWLVAQCDLYAPAASAAQSAFQSAFPPTKQNDALNFSKAEIIAHIKDNLFVQTANTLSDPKTTEPEDMDSKYVRILAASLSALKLFMSLVPLEQQLPLVEEYRSMLQDAKMWKFAKHSQAAIRGAFYALLATLISVHPDLANEFSDKVCPVVLHNLDETDPVVCPPLWEAVLYTVTGVESCWEKVSVRKAVLPKLWRVFREGASGSAVAVYPNLLPLLSQIPASVKGQGTAFYHEFFSNLKLGLTNEKVQLSAGEVGAIVKASMECLRYVLLQNIEDSTICGCLVQDHLLSMLEASLVDSSSALVGSPFYSKTADLMQHLYKLSQTGTTVAQPHASRDVRRSEPEVDTKSTTDEPSTKSQSVCSMLDDLWKTLAGIGAVCVDSSSKATLDRYAMFLISFRTKPSQAKRGKGAKVKFTADDQTRDADLDAARLPLVTKTAAACGASGGQEVASGAVSESYEDPRLLDLVAASCRDAYSRTVKEKSISHLGFIGRLLKVYLGRRLLAAMTEDDVTSPDVDTCPSVCVLERVLSPWMLTFAEELQGGGAGKMALVNSFNDVIVAAYKQCPPEDLHTFLMKLLLAVPDLSIQVRFFGGLVATGCRDPAVTTWMRGVVFGEHLVAVVRSLCRHALLTKPADEQTDDAEPEVDPDACWAMLRMAFSTDQNLEPFIGAQYVEDIIRIIRNSLPAVSHSGARDQEEVSRCVSFVCDVAHNLFGNVKGCLLMNSAEQLLVSLFQLACHPDTTVSDSVVAKLHAAWQSGLRPLVVQRGALLNENGFLVTAANQVKAHLLHDVTSLDKLTKLCDVSRALCACVAEALTDDAAKVQHPSVTALCRLLLMPLENLVTCQWHEGPLVSGDLILLDLPEGAKKVMCPITCLPRHLAPAVYTADMLVAMTTRRAEVTSDEDCEEEGDGPYSPDVALLADIAYTTAFCRAVLSSRRKALAHSELGRILQFLESRLSTVIGNMSQEDLRSAGQHLIDRSLAEGQLWSLGLAGMADMIAEREVRLPWLLMAGTLDRFGGLDEAAAHTLCVLLPHLTGADRAAILDVVVAQILSTPKDDLDRLRLALHVFTETAARQESPLAGEGATGSWSLSPERALSVLGQVQGWKDSRDEVFMFSSRVQDEPWAVTSFSTEVMRLVQVLVTKLPTSLTPGHWDFVMCSLVSWVQSVDESKAELLTHTPTQCFSRAALSLVTTVARCLVTVVPQTPEDFPTSLAGEWTEFFSPAIYSLLLPLYVRLTGEASQETLGPEDYLLRALGAAVATCPVEQVRSHQLPPKLVAADDSNLPDELQTLLNHLAPLLLHRHRALQLSAFKLLMLVMPELPQHDEGKGVEPDDGKDITRSPPAALMSVSGVAGQAVAVVLHGLTLGETMVIEPYIEEHTLAMAYLLSWKLVLAFFRGASPEMRVEYAQYLRQSDAIDHVMQHVFSLMPECPLVNLKDALTSQPPLQKLSSVKNMFAEQPSLIIEDEDSVEELQHVACAVYLHLLRDLPAMLRQWFNSQDKKTTAIVDRYTSKYVSPIICAQELGAIQDKPTDLSNMMIKTRPAAREVVALYTVEEVSMELVVVLPSNHPLGVVLVDSGKRIGVANTQWRNWMLQLTTFLLHQNGSILDGLSLWKRNVDKRFEGLEDCMICFSVIHGSTCQLPKLQCRTCKKKYHSACLYKWFNTSNNSTCPLCRNLF